MRTNFALKLISALLIIVSMFIFVAGIWFIANINQRKRKLLPEFINGKPTVVFFWIDNSSCKAMSSIIDKMKNDFKGSVKVLNFNVIKDYKIAESYLILDVPVVILFDKEGNPIMRITKPEEYQKLEIKLKEII